MQLLLKHEGINDGLLEVFVIYLVSSDRSIADMLAPNRQLIATIFEEQFRGMALMPVTVKELEETRETMISLIRSKLTEPQRQFLLSFKRGEPEWGLLNLTGINELPAIQWKTTEYSANDTCQTRTGARTSAACAVRITRCPNTPMSKSRSSTSSRRWAGRSLTRGEAWWKISWPVACV